VLSRAPLADISIFRWLLLLVLVVVGSFSDATFRARSRAVNATNLLARSIRSQLSSLVASST